MLICMHTVDIIVFAVYWRSRGLRLFVSLRRRAPEESTRRRSCLGGGDVHFCHDMSAYQLSRYPEGLSGDWMHSIQPSSLSPLILRLVTSCLLLEVRTVYRLVASGNHVGPGLHISRPLSSAHPDSTYRVYSVFIWRCL